MVTRGLMLTMSLVLSAVVIAACAKQPATTSVSAPAPTTPPAIAAPGPAPSSPGGGDPAAPAPAAPRGGGESRPATARPAPAEFMAVAALRDAFFDFDKYEIRPEDAQVLDSNASWLKTNLNLLVLIEGHCDERGTNEYNLALGERRAKSAMNYLVSQGVQASRITIISYGEERPQCTERSDSCWAKNRRAHFLVKPR
jgi:peptidoglycan-associated lipoprotein